MEQEREQDLKKHIEEDRKLQKKLEVQYRYTENEKEKIKLEKDIKEIRQRISGWEEEISTISMQDRKSVV